MCVGNLVIVTEIYVREYRFRLFSENIHSLINVINNEITFEHVYGVHTRNKSCLYKPIANLHCFQKGILWDQNVHYRLIPKSPVKGKAPKRYLNTLILFC